MCADGGDGDGMKGREGKGERGSWLRAGGAASFRREGGWSSRLAGPPGLCLC
jgi:hypothetical protein